MMAPLLGSGKVWNVLLSLRVVETAERQRTLKKLKKIQSNFNLQVIDDSLVVQEVFLRDDPATFSDLFYQLFD